MGGEVSGSFGARVFDRWRMYAGLCMLLHAVLALLVFDPKVSIGGDDSWYVLAAQDLVDGVAFPSWHGALYPIVLSPLVWLLGISVPWFKVLSIAFTLGSIWLLADALRGRVHPLAWLVGLGLYAGCGSMAVLSGTTYSEPLFVLIQAWVVHAVVRLDAGGSHWGFSRLWVRRMVELGLALFLLSQVRNVGYGAVVAVVVYLLAVRRDWRGALGSLLGMLLFAVPFSLYRSVAWAQSEVSFSGQLDRILQVDFYNADRGYEDLWGMVVRVALNAKQYLSYYLMEFLGFPIESSSWVVMVVLVLLAVGLLFRRPRPGVVSWWLFIYLVSMLGVTFVTQQVSWSQYRLVIVYLPLILIYLFDRMLASSVRGVGYRTVRYGVIVFAAVSLLFNVAQTGRRVDARTLQANLGGDMYRGLTPDWESYLRMSEWVGRHIPDSVVVACRKPNNSRIYGRRRFFGIFKVPSWSADTVRMFLDSNRVEYVMAGRLRNDVSKRTEQFINTVHFTLSVALQEQPDLLEHIRTEGGSEPTLLFRIHRGGRGTDAEYRSRLESGLLVYEGNVEALHRLARLSLDGRRPDEALEYTHRAIVEYEEAGEQVPYPFLETRGMAYYLMGDYASAIRLFEYLTQQYPEEANLWYNLGICYKRVGDARSGLVFERAAGLRGDIEE